MIAIASILAGTLVSAQVPVNQVRERTGEAADAFSRATAVQELAGDRVVVADARDRALYVVNFADGSVAKLGRLGSGPGEYDAIGPLVRGAGDTIFMPNLASRRLHAILPSGRLGATRVFDVSVADTVRGERPPAGTTRIVGGPRFMDARGRLYHEVTYLDMGRGGVSPSSHIVRLDPSTGESRVVAPLRRWYPERSTRWRAPLMTQDVWAVAPDGRVARVVPDEYHVEWYRDDSLVARGPVVAYRSVNVTSAEREAYWAARASQPAGGAAIGGGPPVGGDAGRSSAPRPAPQRGAVTDADFPRVKPPFVEEYVGETARISPDGEVWVSRAGAFGDSVIVVDVFDAGARRIRQEVLPPHRTVLGFGRGVVYLVRTDDDGLQWLERYRR